MDATMMGRCDAPYGNFHADLALYSYTKEHYCQLYNANPILNYLSPQDGTLLEGSQHVYDNAGNGFDGNIDQYSWNDQNFIRMAVPFPFVPSIPLFSMQTNSHTNRWTVDINLLVMPCATWSFTDAAGQNPTPPHTTCEISDGPQC